MGNSILRELVERLGGLLRTKQRVAGIGDQLQPVHQDVLHYLAQCNRYSNTPAAVTDYLQITKGTVSQSIQVLERRGLVLKQADKEDRRVIRLRLSAKGRRLAARLKQLVSWDHLIDTIDPDTLATGENILTTILSELQRHNDHRSFGQCHTCTHFRHRGPTNFQCGLTGDSLRLEETRQICREHEARGSASTAFLQDQL